MRLPERYKQTIYVSNETFFGSGDFNEPYKLRCLVTPKSDNILYGGGTTTEQNNVELKFESNLKGVELITKNSLIWVKRKPNNKLSNFTHVVVSRDLTTNQWFYTVECRSSTIDIPII